MPIASVIRAKPPPEVAHMLRAPMWLAPMVMLMTQISSSTWRTQMPSSLPWAAIQCRMCDAGLIG